MYSPTQITRQREHTAASSSPNSKMNSTVAQNTTFPDGYHPILVGINAVVLVSGTVSLSLMMHILKSSSTSITSTAVLNLIFTHFIFLVTVPFRIYYYVTSSWSLGRGWCKVVSSMIHVHMYMSFLFYVIILVTRLLAFYRKAEQLASFHFIHALLFSAGGWLTVFIVVPVTVCLSYGQTNITGGNETRLVATGLTALQANALRVLYRKHRQGCTYQQGFGAQLKSLCFALIMVACLVPYHMFRLFYLHHDDLGPVNEVFLSLTTFNCLDMLTFLGKRPCYRCAC
ncbi:unnamed protein product [Pleuronectes platessa]|uniref:G-protein coupled receptors family 1 profile domain-containing protein n=1 Tax=Pleuronectes platessa TaxID=8262 RepID=A0A9N7VB66_PLEPL|nr:unnamed protein product [Pleuronectes platessa]